MTRWDAPPRCGTASAAAAAPGHEDIERTAAALGITRDRLLEECRNISFADIRNICTWEAGLLEMKQPQDGETDWAAVAEIVANAKDRRIYRIKLYDKAPVLNLLTRCLGMFPRNKPNQDDAIDDDGEALRAAIVLELDRVEAETGQGSADQPTAEVGRSQIQG